MFVTTIGSRCVSRVNGSVCIGDECQVYGNDNVIRGDRCLVVGDNNKIYGSGATIRGDNNQVLPASEYEASHSSTQGCPKVVGTHVRKRKGDDDASDQESELWSGSGDIQTTESSLWRDHVRAMREQREEARRMRKQVKKQRKEAIQNAREQTRHAQHQALQVYQREEEEGDNKIEDHTPTGDRSGTITNIPGCVEVRYWAPDVKHIVPFADAVLTRYEDDTLSLQAHNVRVGQFCLNNVLITRQHTVHFGDVIFFVGTDRQTWMFKGQQPTRQVPHSPEAYIFDVDMISRFTWP